MHHEWFFVTQTRFARGSESKSQRFGRGRGVLYLLAAEGIILDLQVSAARSRDR
jgi:hypothetical protein